MVTINLLEVRTSSKVNRQAYYGISIWQELHRRQCSRKHSCCS